MAQLTACDLQRRVSAGNSSPESNKYLCCDSRKCLFKKDASGRSFCILEQPRSGKE